MLFLAALDSAGIPLVGGVDALLITIAILHPAQAYVGAICAVIGSLLGCGFLFGLARKGGDVMLAKHIAEGRGAQLHRWFQRYGLVTVFVPAVSPIPLPMKIPIFCAGALRVSWAYFLSLVFVARILRYFALAYFGQRYGQATVPFLKVHWPIVVSVLAGLAIVVVVTMRLVDRQHSNHNSHPTPINGQLEH